MKRDRARHRVGLPASAADPGPVGRRASRRRRRWRQLGVKTVGDLAALPIDALERCFRAPDGRAPSSNWPPRRTTAKWWPRPPRSRSVTRRPTRTDITRAGPAAPRGRAPGRRGCGADDPRRHGGAHGRAEGSLRRLHFDHAVQDARPVIEDGVTLAKVANELLDAVDLRDGVRLLGVGVTNLVERQPSNSTCSAILTTEPAPPLRRSAKSSATTPSPRRAGRQSTGFGGAALASNSGVPMATPTSGRVVKDLSIVRN